MKISITQSKSIRLDRFTIISLLVYLNFISFSVRGFEEAQTNLFSSDSIIRVISLGLAAVLLLISFTRLKTIRIPGKPIWWLTIYWLIGILSLVNGQWVAYAAVKLFEYGVYLMYAVYVYNLDLKDQSAIRKSFEFFVKFLKFMVFVAVIGLIISPSKALYAGMDEHSAIKEAVLPFILNGWILPLTSTSLCYFAAFLSYFYLLKLILERVSLSNFIFLLLYISVMVISQSRMAILGFFIASMLFFISHSKNKKVCVVILCTGFLLIINFPYLLDFLSRGQDRDMILSVSGRTEWWGHALETFKNQSIFKKIFGGGFAAAEKIVAYQSNAAMYTLDSEFLSVLIGTGFLGLLAFSCSWFTQIKNLFITRPVLIGLTDKDKILWYQASGVLLMIFIRMITATSIAIVTYYMLIYVLCSLVFEKLKAERNINP